MEQLRVVRSGLATDFQFHIVAYGRSRAQGVRGMQGVCAWLAGKPPNGWRLAASFRRIARVPCHHDRVLHVVGAGVVVVIRLSLKIPWDSVGYA